MTRRKSSGEKGVGHAQDLASAAGGCRSVHIVVQPRGCYARSASTARGGTAASTDIAAALCLDNGNSKKGSGYERSTYFVDHAWIDSGRDGGCFIRTTTHRAA